MEEEGWQKDTTPYIIFACKKCQQYIFAKTTQKTKKCLRCGRFHRVSDISNNGNLVRGMKNTLEIIKKRQEEFAIEAVGQVPEFRSQFDFKLIQEFKYQKNLHAEDNDNYERKFQEMLIELTKLYKTFPLYIIEIWAEKYRIPNEELKILMRNLQRQGILIKVKNHSYKFKIRKE